MKALHIFKYCNGKASKQACIWMRRTEFIHVCILTKSTYIGCNERTICDLQNESQNGNDVSSLSFSRSLSLIQIQVESNGNTIVEWEKSKTDISLNLEFA